MVYGVNLGSGDGWSHPGWQGLDTINGLFLDENSILPFEDEQLSCAFSAHFFEHISNEVSEQLFREIFRILKSGSSFRIIVPHVELMLEKYKNNDVNFFTQTIGFSGRPEWKSQGVETSFTNIFLHWIANYDELDEERLVYRGPPKFLPTNDVRQKAELCDVGDFCDWAINFIPEGNNIQTQHINWWTFKKFKKLLKKAGFAKVVESSHMNSSISDVLTTQKFDNWKDRSNFSLYVEATK